MQIYVAFKWDIIYFDNPSSFLVMNQNVGLKSAYAWGIVYTVAQCTDIPNFIFAIKQGGLGTTFDIYNSLLAQLA